MFETLYTKHFRLLKNLKTVFRSHMHNMIDWSERMIGVKGARGVGKTTLLLQHIREEFGTDESCLYVNLDDIALPFENLVNLAEEFEKRGGKYLFLDEVHKYDNWSKELKNIYDSFPELHVIFTGSSMLDILKGNADLSRRAIVYHMKGLSFREFIQIKTDKTFPGYTISDILKNHISICREINESIKPFQYFNDYLKFGYYPFFLESETNYHSKLSNTLSLTLQTDLLLLSNIETQYISKIKKLLNLLSTNVPYKPNISNLSAAIGVSWQSVIHYLQSLHEACIIFLIHQEGKSISSLAKPEMIYLFHPNLFYLFQYEQPNSGSLRESFFLNQVSQKHSIEKAKRGDFVVDGKYYFELGGKNKTPHQIAGVPNSYVVADNIEYGFGNKIPLWLFGFLY